MIALRGAPSSHRTEAVQISARGGFASDEDLYARPGKGRGRRERKPDKAGGASRQRDLCPFRDRSVPRDLWGLPVRCLVGGLDEHGLGDVLTGRHSHLLDLVQLLEQSKPGDH